jgi:hypothetical protein
MVFNYRPVVGAGSSFPLPPWTIWERTLFVLSCPCTPDPSDARLRYRDCANTIYTRRVMPCYAARAVGSIV